MKPAMLKILIKKITKKRENKKDPQGTAKKKQTCNFGFFCRQQNELFEITKS